MKLYKRKLSYTELLWFDQIKIILQNKTTVHLPYIPFLVNYLLMCVCVCVCVCVYLKVAT